MGTTWVQEAQLANSARKVGSPVQEQRNASNVEKEPTTIKMVNILAKTARKENSCRLSKQ
jgi:hypothetical protein